MAGPNAFPVRGHKKDFMFVCLQAVMTSGVFVVDAANTDTSFWNTAVTDTGAGDNSFSFKLSYGARKAHVVGHNLTNSISSVGNTVNTQVGVPNLSTGLVQVTFVDQDDDNADPPEGARLFLTLAVETL